MNASHPKSTGINIQPILFGTMLLVSLLVIGLQGAVGNDATWVGEQGDATLVHSSVGSWFDGMNWSNYTVPDSVLGSDGTTTKESYRDTVILDAGNLSSQYANQGYIYFGDFWKNVSSGGNSHLVTAPENFIDYGINAATAKNVYINSGTWTFNLNSFDVASGNNGSLNVENDLLIGEASKTASLTVIGNSESSLYAANLSVGYGVGSTGTLSVKNTIVAAGNMIIGDKGTGTAIFSDNSTLCIPYSSFIGNNSGSTGTVTVDNSFWAMCDSIYVGYSGKGVLNITNAGTGYSGNSIFIGHAQSGTGSVSVSGTGSNMSTGSDLYVGVSGNGTLSIANGGTVSNVYGCIATNVGATGAVTVDGAGSTWTCSGDLNVGMNGTGTLSITNGAAVIAAGSCIGYGNEAIGLVNVSGSDSTWTLNGGLEVAAAGKGTVNITNGGSVSSLNSSIGHMTDSQGIVSVSGQGSTWNNTYVLDVGYYGNGALNITNGGAVTSGSSIIGHEEGSTGTVTVNGSGSTWTNTGTLEVGVSGTGTLNILNGGHVTASQVSINSQSQLVLDIGSGSLLEVNGENGIISNNGVVRLIASTNTASGTYTPISADTWEGTGVYESLGGKWTANHTFIVSDAIQTSAGKSVTFDCAETQRVFITDTNKSIGVSFAATEDSSLLTFTATAISGSVLSSLGSLLNTGESVLCGWLFDADGYTQGNAVYLSFEIGSGFSLDDLNLWHYDDETGVWSSYSTTGLTYDNLYAYFTVYGFSGYAITSEATANAVPEPATFTLWASLLGFASCICRRRRVTPNGSHQ